MVTATVLGSWLIFSYRTSSPINRYASLSLAAAVAPMAIVGVVYVLLSAFRPELLGGPGGAVVVVRMTVKLLTMTTVFVYTMRFVSTRS